jgi:hypothetical protein
MEWSDYQKVIPSNNESFHVNLGNAFIHIDINIIEFIELDQTKIMEVKLLSHPIFHFYICGLTPSDFI